MYLDSIINMSTILHKNIRTSLETEVISSKLNFYAEFCWKLKYEFLKYNSNDFLSDLSLKSEKFTLLNTKEECYLQLISTPDEARILKAYLILYIAEDSDFKLDESFHIHIYIVRNDIIHNFQCDNFSEKVAIFSLKLAEFLKENNNNHFNNEISIILKMYKEKSSKKIYSIYNKMSILNKNISKLYEEKKNFDVTFIIGNDKLQAHSLLLITISDYYRNMFSSDNKENFSREINLSNDPLVTFDVFKGFLDYVYGCKTVEDLKDIAKELLRLADQYQMNELKYSCELLLSNQITQENVIEILQFSEIYNCSFLMVKAVSIAKHCIQAIKAQKEFDEILNYNNLTSQLLLAESEKPYLDNCCISEVSFDHMQFKLLLQNYNQRSSIIFKEFFIKKFTGCKFLLTVIEKDESLSVDVYYIYSSTLKQSEYSIQFIKNNVRIYVSNENLYKYLPQENNLLDLLTKSQPSPKFTTINASKIGNKYNYTIVTSYIIPSLHLSYVKKYNSINLIIDVFCKEDFKTNMNPSISLKKEIISSSISEKLNIFYNEQKFCDVEFEIDGEKILAHSLVLATLSPRFAEMFETTQKHKNQWYLNLNNKFKYISAEVFKYFLKFVYEQIASTEDLDKCIILQLVYFSCEIQLESSLQRVFESAVSDLVDEDNVVEVLQNLSECKESSLKDKAIIIARNYIKKTKDLSKFQNLLKNKDLVIDLM